MMNTLDDKTVEQDKFDATEDETLKKSMIGNFTDRKGFYTSESSEQTGSIETFSLTKTIQTIDENISDLRRVLHLKL